MLFTVTRAVEQFNNFLLGTTLTLRYRPNMRTRGQEVSLKHARTKFFLRSRQEGKPFNFEL